MCICNKSNPPALTIAYICASMIRKLSFYLIAACAVCINACRKDAIITDPSAVVEFSSDTLIFDTVFTTIGSTTKWLKVYNNHKQAIVISSIAIAGGSASNFRMNVDGVPVASAKDIEIKSGDSLFIFVEVTVDPNGAANPLIITDSIVFITNGNVQDVDLVAWGQDAYFYPSTLFEGNVTLPADKPNVFYGYSFVDTAGVLTIPAGAQVHFHEYSGLAVLKDASLKVLGQKDNRVTMQGDRLEYAYSEVPGQWGHPVIGGIWLTATSVDNVINYAIIKNGNIGIQADSVGNLNPVLRLTNSIITNMSGVALLGQGSDIVSTNCLFANCGQYVAALVIGGRNYQFIHCTFANFWPYGNRQNPLLLLNNYYEDANQTVHVRDLDNAYFGNCIIYGSSSEEMGIDGKSGAAFNYTFDHCLIKTELGATGSHFQNITKNPPVDTLDGIPHGPVFNDSGADDYHLYSQSAAIDLGSIAIMDTLTSDLDGATRVAPPDLGAYEFQ